MTSTWLFSYPHRSLDKDKKLVWRIQDLRESSSYMADCVTKTIFHLFLRKCDHFFSEPREDGTYDLVIAFDGYNKNCYARERLMLWHELQCYTLDHIKVYLNHWEDMKVDDQDTVIMESGVSHYLSDIIASNELYEKFLEAWTNFPALEKLEQTPEMPVEQESLHKIREIMSNGNSICKAERAYFDGLSKMCGEGMKDMQKQLEKVREMQTNLKLAQNSSLVIIKPKSVAKGMIEAVMGEFTKRGYKLLNGKIVTATKEQAEEHYQEHRGKPWFEKITTALSSGPIFVVYIASEDPNCVANIRKLVGATDPREAEASTIRAKYGTSVDDNVIHASDSPESADREKRMWAKILYRP